MKNEKNEKLKQEYEFITKVMELDKEFKKKEE